MAGLALPVRCLYGWFSVSFEFVWLVKRFLWVVCMTGFALPVGCLYGWFRFSIALFVWLV